MSIWMRASSSPNRKLASALDSSVLPTPDGPAKMNEPDGRLGSFSPARVRRIAFDTARTASSWPMIRLCSSSSMRSNRVVSASVSLNTGIPVQLPSTSAISLSSTSATTSRSPERHCFSRSARWPTSCFSRSRKLAAFSKSCASIADSFSRRASAIFSSNSRRSGGAVILVVRLVAVAQAFEYFDGVLHRRLADLHRLEPALQGGVLLDVLAVLVEGGRTNGLQLTAGQLRLEDRRRVDRTFGRSGTDQRVQLVDEQDDVAAGVDLLEYLLQALLEVTAVAAAGHQRTKVEGVELLVFQRLGDL